MADKEKGKLGPHDVFYLGKEAFIKNKRTMRRHKDLADWNSWVKSLKRNRSLMQSRKHNQQQNTEYSSPVARMKTRRQNTE